MERKTCPCGAVFPCGRAPGEERCWCAGQPQVMPVPPLGSACLCPGCLEREIARRRPRIVSLLPAATDILRALGAGDQLVGVSHLCEAPPELARVLSTPIDSDAWDMKRIHEEVRRVLEAGESLYVPDDTRITALRPDLILTQGLCPVCAAGPETVESLKVKLVTLSPHSLEDVARDIETVGVESGHAEAGREVARRFRARIEAVRASRSGRSPKPRVTVIEWYSPLWVSGEWIIDMVEAAGGEYVPLKRGESSRPVEWSELHQSSPDIIILAPCSMSVDRAHRETRFLEERPEWHALRAVRSGRVALLDGSAHFSAPGPRLAEGVESLASVLDKFST